MSGGIMDDKARERLQKQAEINAARMAGSLPNAGLPQPPYHVHGVKMMYLMCRFDPAALARIVPAGLTPSGTGWGIIGLYEARTGWGIAPFSAFFMTAELSGIDSSDGSPGNYMHSGLFSGVAGQVMTSRYNTNFRLGWSRQEVVDGQFVGEAGDSSGPIVRVRARVSPNPPSTLSGVSRYVGRRVGAGFSSYSVAWTIGARDTSDQSVEFLDGAADRLKVVHPLEYVWPVYIETMDMAFTAPHALDEDRSAGEEARSADLGALFNRLGRPAAILSADGTVLSLNHEAHGLLADGRLVIANSRIAGRGDDVRALEAILRATLSKGAESISERIALRGGEGSLPLLAQMIALDSGSAGPGRSLVTFDDPSRDAGTDPGPALQLLGLTPAEARIAGLVGAGRSPREAADELNLTLNTVRSAIKVVFSKLGIGRQSELAKIVARLAG